MKKLISLLIVTIMVGGLVGCSNTASKTFKIGVIQQVQHASLEEIYKGVIDGLADKGFKDGDKIKIDFQNGNGDVSTMTSIAQKFVSDDVDCIVTIGTLATQACQSETKDIPIIAVGIADFKGAKLVNDLKAPDGNITGVSHIPADQINNQIDLMLEISPNAKSYGIIYTSSEINAQSQAETAISRLTQLNKANKIETIANINDLQQVFESLSTKVQIIYIPTDNVIAQSMPLIRQLSVEYKIPVICGAVSMVESGGLATISASQFRCGELAAPMIIDLLQGNKMVKDIPIGYSDTNQIVLNQKLADEIGIKFNDNLISKATKIIK